MAELSTADRRALPRSDFAIPEKAPGPGSYPIPDEEHGRDALSRVEENGDARERRRVIGAVSRKFPDMEIDAEP
jgi:hypothetical protein